MPYTIKKRKCMQSNGTKGNFVIIKTDTGKKKSCHKTMSDAQKALAVLKQKEEQERRLR